MRRIRFSPHPHRVNRSCHRHPRFPITVADAHAVLTDMVEQVVSTPDLGDTRKELIAFADAAVKILGTTLMGRVMQGLVPDLATDPTSPARSASESSRCGSRKYGA